MVKESEFGRGLTYCLALFLCHSERHNPFDKKKYPILAGAEMWFNASADHLYDLEIPETLPVSLQKRLKKLQNKSLGWRYAVGKEKEATDDDKAWAINEAKDLIRLIDKHHGVKTSKGSWQ